MYGQSLEEDMAEDIQGFLKKRAIVGQIFNLIQQYQDMQLSSSVRVSGESLTTDYFSELAEQGIDLDLENSDSENQQPEKEVQISLVKLW